MALKTETVTVIKVNYSDMERYLTEKLGRQVEILDSPNDTDYNFTVSKSTDDWTDEDAVKSFLENGYISMDYGYCDIFNYCCQQGWIEPGEYVMAVSW